MPLSGRHFALVFFSSCTSEKYNCTVWVIKWKMIHILALQIGALIHLSLASHKGVMASDQSLHCVHCSETSTIHDDYKNYKKWICPVEEEESTLHKLVDWTIQCGLTTTASLRRL